MNIITIAIEVGGAKRYLSSSSLCRKYNYNTSFVQHHCRFTTQTKQTNNNKYHQKRYISLAAAGATTAVGASLYTRHVREQRLSTLVLAEDSGLLCCGSTTSNNESDISYTCQKYNVPYLIESVTRAGLVGSTKSVKDELEALRKWHSSHGYNGGIVLRDITRPLFSLNSLDFFDHGTDDEEGKNQKDTHNNSLMNEHKSNLGKAKSSDDNNIIVDPDHINRRECYYLYYEIHSDGHTRQQLFCRGTTLLADVLTCLQTFFVYDEELECHIHYGFNQHANRIVNDVMPLLKVGDQSTVEVCGHSLGGAVAMLVAIKLRKRGYTVTRVVSLASPRFCRGIKEREILQKWLPSQTIRIEDDLDVVTYLPPMGVSVGDKLWFAKDRAYMLSKDSISGENDWADYVWLNLRLFETILNQSKKHRVMSYVNSLEKLLGDISRSDD